MARQRSGRARAQRKQAHNNNYSNSSSNSNDGGDSSSAATKAQAVPPSDVFNHSLVHRTANASANFIQYFQQEVRAILRTELVHLPDVQCLLHENLFVVESLKLGALPGLLRTFKDTVFELPQVLEYVMDNIDSLPDWKQYIAAHVPDCDGASWPMGRALQRILLEGLGSDSLSLPPQLVENVGMMPEPCAALLKAMDNMSLHIEDLQALLQRDGLVLKDVHDLVMDNVHRLPHLQQVLHEHYMSWRPCLKSFQRVPDWMQDNKHVHSGYRPELLSFRRCFYSLAYVHNETGNIYTHLLGVLFFLALSCYTSYFVFHNRENSDQIVMNIFFAGSITCLMCSVLFHTCFVHSAHMNCFFSKLDYGGITALIFASVFSCIYLFFYWHEYLRVFYLGLAFVCAVLCAWASFSDSYRGNDEKWVRLVLFIAFAATGAVPALHYSVTHGFDEASRAAGLEWVGLSIVLYLMGALVYITKFPECFRPGRFDLWCHSHQLWHCFVVAAAVAHYVGIKQGFDHRHEQLISGFCDSHVC